MTIKGIAVISGSAENVKHEMDTTGDAQLGVEGSVSTLSGTIQVLGINQDLVSTLETVSGSIVQQITDSIALMNPVSGNVEAVRQSMAASAYVDGNDNGHDYVKPDGTNYISGVDVTSLKAADIKLDTGLKNAADDLNVTVQGAAEIAGSLTNLIDTLLKGTGVDDTWATLSGLKTAMNDDSALSASIKIKIDTMEDAIRGNDAAAPEDLITILAGLTDHRDTAGTGATAREAALAAKLASSKAALGLEADFSLDFTADAPNYISDIPASLTAVDNELGTALKGRDDRLTATTGSADVGGFTAGARTENLTVAAGATAAFSGSVTATEFTVPVFTTPPTAFTQGDQAGNTGEVFYLQTAGTAPFNVAEKFYFCEDGEWFMSPFMAEEGAEPAQDPAPDYDAIEFTSDNFASEFELQLNLNDGNGPATLITGLSDGQTQIDLSAHGALAPQEATQTLSLSDSYGDGGILSVDFKNPDTDAIVLSIVPSYTSGPYDIDVVWNGSILSVNGTTALSYANGVWGIPDADSDGVGDAADAFPNDPTEWADLNENDLGDNADISTIETIAANGDTATFEVFRTASDTNIYNYSLGAVSTIGSVESITTAADNSKSFVPQAHGTGTGDYPNALGNWTPGEEVSDGVFTTAYGTTSATILQIVYPYAATHEIETADGERIVLHDGTGTPGTIKCKIIADTPSGAASSKIQVWKYEVVTQDYTDLLYDNEADADNDGTIDSSEPSGDFDNDGIDAVDDADVQISVMSTTTLPTVIVEGSGFGITFDPTAAEEDITVTEITWSKISNSVTYIIGTSELLNGTIVAGLAKDDLVTMLVRYTLDADPTLAGAVYETAQVVVPDYYYTYTLNQLSYGSESSVEVTLNGNTTTPFPAGSIASNSTLGGATFALSEGDTHTIKGIDSYGDGGLGLSIDDNGGNTLVSHTGNDFEDFVTYTITIEGGLLKIEQDIDGAGNTTEYLDDPDVTSFFMNFNMSDPPMLEQTVSTNLADISDNDGVTAIDMVWQSNDPADNGSGTGFGNPSGAWTDIGVLLPSTIDVSDPAAPAASGAEEDIITITSNLEGKILRAKYVVTDGAGNQSTFYVPSDEEVAEFNGGHAIIEEESDIPTTFMDPLGNWETPGIFEYNSGQGVYSSTIRAQDTNLMDAANPFSISSQGANGTATITADSPDAGDIRYGNWAYTPSNPGTFTGADVFTIKVVDAEGNEAVQDITINLMSPDSDFDNTLDPVDAFPNDPGEQTAVMTVIGAPTYDGAALHYTFVSDFYTSEPTITFTSDGVATTIVDGGNYLDNQGAWHALANNVPTANTPVLPVGSGSSFLDISFGFLDDYGDGIGEFYIHRADQTFDENDPNTYLVKIDDAATPGYANRTQLDTRVASYDGRFLVVDGGDPVDAYPSANVVDAGTQVPSDEGENMLNAIAQLETLQTGFESGEWEASMTTALYDVEENGILSAGAQASVASTMQTISETFAEAQGYADICAALVTGVNNPDTQLGTDQEDHYNAQLAASVQAAAAFQIISGINAGLQSFASPTYDTDGDGTNIVDDPIPGVPLGLTYPAIIPMTTETVTAYSVNDYFDQDGAEFDYSGSPAALHPSGSWTSPSGYAGAAFKPGVLKTMARRPFTLSFMVDIPSNSPASDSDNAPRHILGTKHGAIDFHGHGGFSIQTEMMEETGTGDPIPRPFMESGIQVGNYYTIASLVNSSAYNVIADQDTPHPDNVDNTINGPQSGFPIRAGEKTYVSLVRDGDEMRVYINGALHLWDLPGDTANGDTGEEYIDLMSDDGTGTGSRWLSAENGMGDLYFGAYAAADGGWYTQSMGHSENPISIYRVRINDIAEDAAQVAADSVAAFNETTDTDEDGVFDEFDAFPDDPSETVASAETGVGVNMMAQHAIYAALDFNTATQQLITAASTQDGPAMAAAHVLGDDQKVIAEACKAAALALISDSTDQGGTPSTEQTDKKVLISNGIDTLLADWQTAKDTHVLPDADGDGVPDINDAFPNDINYWTDTDPVITILGKVETSVMEGYAYSDAGATATDAEEGSFGDVATHASGSATSNVNTAVPGLYTVVYSIEDTHGNITTATRNVTVIALPVITLTGPVAEEYTQNTAATGPSGAWTDPGYTAVDADGADIAPLVDREIFDAGDNLVVPLDLNYPGVYTVRYNVEDPNTMEMAIEKTRTITVLVDTDDDDIADIYDNVPFTIPEITVQGASALTYIQDGSTFWTDTDGATATDAEDGSLTANIVTRCWLPDMNGTEIPTPHGNDFNILDTPSGTDLTYLITYDVTDSHGNAAVQKTRTVTVTADSDYDGTADSTDAFPYNSTETTVSSIANVGANMYSQHNGWTITTAAWPLRLSILQSAYNAPSETGTASAIASGDILMNAALAGKASTLGLMNDGFPGWNTGTDYTVLPGSVHYLAQKAIADTIVNGFDTDIAAWQAAKVTYAWVDADNDDTPAHLDDFDNDPEETITASSDPSHADYNVGMNMMAQHAIYTTATADLGTATAALISAYDTGNTTALASAIVDGDAQKVIMEGCQLAVIMLIDDSENALPAGTPSAEQYTRSALISDGIDTLLVAWHADKQTYVLVDADSDGTFDNLDAFPNDAAETVESSETGVGANMYAEWQIVDGLTLGQTEVNAAQAAFDLAVNVGSSEAAAFTALLTSAINIDAAADTAYQAARSLLDVGFPNWDQNDSQWNPSDPHYMAQKLKFEAIDAAATAISDAFKDIGEHELIDSDGDGVFDHKDDFPADPTETTDSDGDSVGDIADAFPNDPSESVASSEAGVGANMMAQFTIYDNLDFAAPTTALIAAYDAGDTAGLATAITNGDTEKQTAETCKAAALALISDSISNVPAGTPSAEQVIKKDTISNGIDALLVAWQQAKNTYVLVDSDGDNVFDNLDAFPYDISEDTRANSDPNHADYNVGANMMAQHAIFDALDFATPTATLIAAYDAGDTAGLATAITNGNTEKTTAEACKAATEALIAATIAAGGTPSQKQIDKKNAIVTGINTLLNSWQAVKDTNTLTDSDGDGIYAEPIAAQNSFGDPDDNDASDPATPSISDFHFAGLSNITVDAARDPLFATAGQVNPSGTNHHVFNNDAEKLLVLAGDTIEYNPDGNLTVTGDTSGATYTYKLYKWEASVTHPYYTHTLLEEVSTNDDTTAVQFGIPSDVMWDYRTGTSTNGAINGIYANKMLMSLEVVNKYGQSSGEEILPHPVSYLYLHIICLPAYNDILWAHYQLASYPNDTWSTQGSTGPRFWSADGVNVEKREMFIVTDVSGTVRDFQADFPKYVTDNNIYRSHFAKGENGTIYNNSTIPLVVGDTLTVNSGTDANGDAYEDFNVFYELGTDTVVPGPKGIFRPSYKILPHMTVTPSSNTELAPFTSSFTDSNNAPTYTLDSVVTDGHPLSASDGLQFGAVTVNPTTGDVESVLQPATTTGGSVSMYFYTFPDEAAYQEFKTAHNSPWPKRYEDLKSQLPSDLSSDVTLTSWNGKPRAEVAARSFSLDYELTGYSLSEIITSHDNNPEGLNHPASAQDAWFQRRRFFTNGATGITYASATYTSIVSDSTNWAASTGTSTALVSDRTSEGDGDVDTNSYWSTGQSGNADSGVTEPFLVQNRGDTLTVQYVLKYRDPNNNYHYAILKEKTFNLDDDASLWQ
jgi:hypothetical protein